MRQDPDFDPGQIIASETPVNQPSPKPELPAKAAQPASKPAEPRSARNPAPGAWGNDHRVNIRLSIPLLFWRFYLVVVAGKERRGAERRAQERRCHPLFKPGNAIAFGYIGMVALLALGALIGAAVIMLLRSLFEIEMILQ